MRIQQLALALVVVLAVAPRAEAATCSTPPNPRSQIYDDGLDLARGYLSTLRIAELGPISVFHDECATAASGVTFGTLGVYSNVDDSLVGNADGSLGLVSLFGILTYRPGTDGTYRQLPDDGSFIVRNPDLSFSLRSAISTDELVYRSFASKNLLVEIRHTTGDVAAPFMYTVFYDRAASGALQAIRRSNSGDRITLEATADGVRVAYTLANRSQPADWFTLHRSGNRLQSIELPEPQGSAFVTYALSTSGKILHVDHPAGSSTKYRYDSAGRVTDKFVFEVVPNGPENVVDHTRYAYAVDAQGTTTSVASDRDGDNEATRHSFAPNGLLARTSVGGIDVVALSYDGYQRVATAEYPPSNTVLSYGYNGNTEAVAWVVRNYVTLPYYVSQFDASGQLPMQVLIDNVAVQASYDAFGRPIQIIDHDSTRSFSYTAAGAGVVDECTIEEPSGLRACNRVDYSRGDAVVRSSNGRVGLELADQATSFELDASELVTRVTESTGPMTTAVRTFSAFDDRGKPAYVTMTDYVLGGPTQTSWFGYNPDGSVASENNTYDGLISRFAYDAAGQLRQMTLSRRGLFRADAATTVSQVDVTPSSTCGAAQGTTVNGAPATASTEGNPQSLPPDEPDDGDPVDGFPDKTDSDDCETTTTTTTIPNALPIKVCHERTIEQ